MMDFTSSIFLAINRNIYLKPTNKTNVLKSIDFLVVYLYNERRKYGEAECGCHPT